MLVLAGFFQLWTEGFGGQDRAEVLLCTYWVLAMQVLFSVLNLSVS